jgi:outer membrane protein assembly factor BamB
VTAQWRGGRWLLATSLGVLLLACAGSDKPKPTPLTDAPATIAGRQVWSRDIGAVAAVMLPVAKDGVFYVAASNGDVLALRADSGAEVWRASAGETLAAGVGSDGRFTSVVTRRNEVVTFEAGRELWRKRVPSSVVTPPLVAGERVFVMGVDRAVHAFDAIDGRRLWTLQRPGDALTLAQPGVVAAFKNNLLVGQGPRLTALDSVRGSLLWELALASPRGSNEVERLADLVGPLLRVGERVCARAFQSSVACADAARGTLLWTRNVGGLNAVAGDDERVFGADASDRITAWKAANGDVAWTNEKLLYRGLSGALAVGPSVVFGDGEGQLHFLATASGETQLRLPTDGSAILGAPVISETTILVLTKKGGLFAFRPS